MPAEARGEVNRVFANMGKVIAAYVRLIVPTPSRFDRYVAEHPPYMHAGQFKTLREVLEF